MTVLSHAQPHQLATREDRPHFLTHDDPQPILATEIEEGLAVHEVVWRRVRPMQRKMAPSFQDPWRLGTHETGQSLRRRIWWRGNQHHHVLVDADYRPIELAAAFHVIHDGVAANPDLGVLAGVVANLVLRWFVGRHYDPWKSILPGCAVFPKGCRIGVAGSAAGSALVLGLSPLHVDHVALVATGARHPWSATSSRSPASMRELAPCVGHVLGVLQ